MTWVHYIILSVGFFTFLNILQKVLANEVKNLRALSVVFNLYAGVIAVTMSAFTGGFTTFSVNKTPKALLVLLFACLMYAGFERLRFVASKQLDASIYTTVATLSVAVAFVLSIFIYKESVDLQKLLGFVLIVGSLIMLANPKAKNIISLKGLLLAIISFTFLGIAGSLDKLGTTLFNSESYSIFVWTIPLIFVYLPYIPFVEIKKAAHQGSWKVVVLAFINVFGYYFQLKALETADATLIIPLVQVSGVLSVILGIILLKEHDIIYRKILSGVLATIGVILLS